MAGLEDGFAPPERFSDSFAALHEVASSQLDGWSDFGPDDYHQGLNVLLLAMDRDVRWTERGRRIGWGELINALTARGIAYREMAANPGFDNAPMQPPLIITGIPRTGTTALHRLLALDPQFQGLQTWLTAAPQPRPARETWEINPAFQKMVRQLEARYATKPGARALHDMAAEEVDECCFVLRQGFVSNLWTVAAPAPSYDLWWQAQSEAACYRHLDKVLRLIGKKEPDKRWLLKNPGHVDQLDEVFAVFPEAKVVVTHRDPAKAVPSLVSLMIRNYPTIVEGPVELHAKLMGLRETEKWARAANRAAKVAAERPGQVLDVLQSDLHKNAMGLVERIYAFAGLELKPDVRAAMAVRADAKPELALGEHRYDIADYGLSEDYVRERFGKAYCERHGFGGQRG